MKLCSVSYGLIKSTIIISDKCMDINVCWWCKHLYGLNFLSDLFKSLIFHEMNVHLLNNLLTSEKYGSNEIVDGREIISFSF